MKHTFTRYFLFSALLTTLLSQTANAAATAHTISGKVTAVSTGWRTKQFIVTLDTGIGGCANTSTFQVTSDDPNYEQLASIATAAQLASKTVTIIFFKDDSTDAGTCTSDGNGNWLVYTIKMT